MRTIEEVIDEVARYNSMDYLEREYVREQIGKRLSEIEEIHKAEQERISKIRAEIENDWQLKKYPSSPFSCGLRRAIEIIDKYKGEEEIDE